MIMELDHSRQREGDGTVRYGELSTSFLARHRVVVMLQLNKLNSSENNDMKRVAAATMQADRIEQTQSEFGYQSQE